MAPTEELIAQGLSTLTRLDRPLWAKRMERVLRNPKSTLWIHVPKDGITASTLGLLSRLWLFVAWSFLIGLVLVDLDARIPLVTGLGWFLIALGTIGFLIAVSRVIKASTARRAWRRGPR
jgi:hypothetical protein